MKNEPFVIERIFNAPVSAIWKAITDKDQMKHWYFDLEEFKPEVGFEFKFEGGDEAKSYLHLCKVTEVIVGKKLTYSWRYDGYAGNSFVTFELFEEGERTRLKLTHEGLETFPIENRDLAKENFEAGWEQIIGSSLKGFVESGTIHTSIEINASAEEVWEVLTAPDYTKQWANEFGKGTYVETNWQIGTEVLWKDKGGNIGAKGKVEQHEYPSTLKIAFFDDVNSSISSPTGAYSENYLISKQGDKVTLSIEAGLLPQKDLPTHLPLWDKAIVRMKELAEEKQ